MFQVGSRMGLCGKQRAGDAQRKVTAPFFLHLTDLSVSVKSFDFLPILRGKACHLFVTSWNYRPHEWIKSFLPSLLGSAEFSTRWGFGRELSHPINRWDDALSWWSRMQGQDMCCGRLDGDIDISQVSCRVCNPNASQVGVMHSGAAQVQWGVYWETKLIWSLELTSTDAAYWA